MEFKNNDLKKMSVKDVFKALLPSTMEIYNSTKYLEIPKNVFYELVLKEINKTKNDYNGSKPYYEFIKKRVRISIVENERKLSKDRKEAYRILNNYINYYVNDLFKFDNLLSAFKKIDRIISLYECELDPGLIVDLLKNNTFNTLIKKIVDNLLPNLSHKKIERMYNNTSFISVIEVYAEINNIEFKEIDEEIEEDYYTENDLNIYLKDISSKRVLTSQEEKEVFRRYQNGDMEAKNELIECNLKLAVSFAKKQYNIKQPSKGLSLQDLIQEANLGLLKSLETFDPTKGCKFSTYAVNWIRQKVARAKKEKERTVKIPVYLYDGLSSYMEKVNLLTSELHREPTLDEIAERFNIPLNKVIKYNYLLLDEKSLNECVGEDKDVELEDYFLHSENDVEDHAFAEQLKDDIKKVFEIVDLTSREVEVLKLRFGFYDNNIKTLQEIADEYGLTKQRIKQIELGAISKIRRNIAAIEILSSYTSYTGKFDNIIASGYGVRKKILTKNKK